LAFTGALLLVLVLLLRPMELWPPFAQLHSLEVLTAITALGIGLEMSSARRAPGGSPQIGWLLAFLAWAYAVTVARLGVTKGFTVGWSMTLGPIFMLLVTYSLRRIERLRTMMAVLLACSVFVSVVCIHQGLQPRECIAMKVDPADPDSDPEPEPDGRECLGPRLCEQDAPAGQDYLCERVGKFGTYSTQGRVRWRGQLDDPNEVAVVIGALLPFIFMFWANPTKDDDAGARRVFALVGLAVTLALGLWAMVYTQSRGGQLVLATVVVIMLVRRYGWWSLLGGVLVTLPIVALSWRSGADAESSTVERAEILSEGLMMLRAHPLLGIGIGQFASENPMNMAAHNSYLLVATELGFPGFVVWWGLVWTTVKIPLAISRRPPEGLDPSIIRFAEALTASVVGLHIGVFFLSFVYKHIFFVWLGLSGALYGAAREKHPELEVRLGGRDYAGMVGLAVASIIMVRLVSMGAR